MDPENSYHPAEGAAAAPQPGAARATSLATLLANHVLRDGELVLLVIKPSLWFIPFNSAVFSAITIICAASLAMLNHRMHDRFYIELAFLVIAGRLIWVTLQWLNRLYILTDLRVLRFSGVFVVDMFDCPLRKVVRTRIVSPPRERFVRVGSIEIIPRDETMPTAVWQTIAKPYEILEQLRAAIKRAKQTGTGAE
ncbi:MAG: PH domain-containing protein [Tepidisphaeraceae bacterium]|jgi:hypothetical protein